MRNLWRELKLRVHAWRVGWRSGRAAARMIVNQTKLRWMMDSYYEKIKQEGAKE